jgi:putative inorganic carbon (HCO3(-)) transporter
MAERAVWRPPLFAWPVLGLAALLPIQSRLPWLLHGHWLFVTMIALGAMLMIAAALWELPPATMMCAAIALTIFSGSWTSVGLPGFPFVPDRILLAGALLALLLGAPGASGVPRVQVKGVHLLLALTVFYATTSAAAAGTLGTKAGVFDLLDRLGAIPFLMLLVAPVIFSGRWERNLLLATLVGLGAYLGITALFETIGPHGLVFPSYIGVADAVTPTGQAGGPFRTPMTEGFACYACGVAAMIAYAQWRGAWSRRFAAAVAVISLLACFLSLERAVWIAAVVGLIAVGLAERRLWRWIARAAVTFTIVIAAALVLAPNLAGQATARAGTQLSVWDRQNQTAAAMRMIAAKPLFGFGWDRYETQNIDYFRQASSYPMTGVFNHELPLPLHNSYLSNAVDLGLVGALLWLACLIWGLGGAVLSPVTAELRPWRLGLIAIAAFFAVVAFFDPLQQNFSELLLWVWAGVVLGGSVSRRTV